MYAKSPFERKNMIAALSIRVDTWSVAFRIDPSTFELGDQVRDVKGWWFKNERRINRTKDNEDLIFKCLEHAKQTTEKK